MTNALYEWYWGKIHPYFFDSYETDLKAKSKWLVCFIILTFLLSLIALGVSVTVYQREGLRSKSLLVSYDNIVMIENKAYIPVEFDIT